jgi:hypothetical protein
MQDGDRVLTKAEWELFCVGLEVLCDLVEEDIANESDDTDTGTPAFDRLTPEQKLVLLAETARALHEPKIPTPRLTAANEAAIAAVFSMIRTELELELDTESASQQWLRPTIRQLILATCEGSDGWEEPLPEESERDPEEWGWLLEVFEDRIFWDHDFAVGDIFLDLPPEHARATMTAMGIDADYFLDVPMEPNKRGLTAAREVLDQLFDQSAA